MEGLGEYPLMLFDGVCNLCNRTVQFIVRHDRRKIFRFASLQSGAGDKLIREIRANGQDIPDSVVLVYKGYCYTKSDAALRIARLLGGIWAVLYAGILLPPFIRNGIYDLIARNRYKWFGRREECMIPDAGLRSRFLSE